MAKEHGLAGLFGGKGQTDNGDKPSADLPPVLDDANASPLERLAKKLGDADPYAEPPAGLDDDVHHSPFGLMTPDAPEAKETQVADTPPPAPTPVSEAPQARDPNPPATPAPPAQPDRAPAAAGGAVAAAASRPAFKRTRPPLQANKATSEDGILCFLLEGGDDRLRRRTLEALTEAAGHHGAINLRALPNDVDGMNHVLTAALHETSCVYAAFFTPGTEPADDWALEVQSAFEKNPSAAAVSVRAANSDPLSPWARVSFFIDEAERQKGVARGFDTMVFRIGALRELGDNVGFAVRNGEVVHALQGQGQRLASAVEARVKLATPTSRQDVMRRVREQARAAARIKAKNKNPIARLFSAMFIVLGFPFRILAVRRAAKRAVGSAQFREVASKATMAVFADRRVRALTMLNPGKAR